MPRPPSLAALADSPHYAAARQRVVRQLVESLCYEGLLPVAWRPQGGELVGEVCANGPSYVLRARRRTTFDRLALTALRRGDGATAGPREVLRDLADLLPAAPDRLDRFADELERTALNHALAGWHGAEGDDAHPYHPSFKSRVGFDLADNLAFGPEFGPVVTPRWVAVDRALAAATPSARTDVPALLAAELGEQLTEFRAHLAERGRRLDDVALVPVHPWQWRERLAHRLAPLIAAGSVTDLGPAGTTYRPRASIRTLANAERADRCDLKLALGIANTSTERTLASHTVANAAPISDWLHDTAAADPTLRRLVVLREIVGVSVDDLDGHLAAIWRQSPASQLRPGESAVSFMRLATPVGPTDATVRARLAHDGAGAWVRQLLDVALVPLVHLLVGHGIALEAHAQNLLLIHRDGWPARLAVQDLHDGVRFARGHLAAPRTMPALTMTPEAHLAANRNSYVEAASPADVRDFLLDALLFVNLGELAMTLQDQALLSEARFWQLARDALATHRRRHPDLAEGYDTFDVLAPTVHVEQLTARRLLPESQRRVHEVANPLAGAGSARGSGC